MIAASADFDWDDAGDSDIIVRHQPAIAVYANGTGSVVVRQERAWDEDTDLCIFVRPENAKRIAEAILFHAGLVAVQPSSSDKPGEAQKDFLQLLPDAAE